MALLVYAPRPLSLQCPALTWAVVDPWRDVTLAAHATRMIAISPLLPSRLCNSAAASLECPVLLYRAVASSRFELICSPQHSQVHLDACQRGLWRTARAVVSRRG